VGTYNPALEAAQVTIQKEKVEYWLVRGAQVSDTVKSLLKRQGVRVSR
jgi:small subunit ribosomal protein S16